MRAMPCVAHLLYANVLAVALLAAVAISKSVADGVAVDTLNATPAPGLIKRYLQSHADTTTSDHAYNFEERVLPSSVESGVSTLLNGVKTLWGQVFSESSNGLFKRYELDKNKDKLFENPNFPEWVTRVTTAAQERNQDPFAKMIKTLSKQYNDDALLAETLLTAATKIDNSESTAAKLLDAQCKSWNKAGKSLKDVFRLLKLDQTRAANELFKKPVFPQWANFVNVKLVSDEAATRAMFDFISQRYGYANVVVALTGGAKVEGVKKTTLNLVDHQLKIWKDERKSAEDVYQLLVLPTVGNTEFKLRWFNYAKAIDTEPQEVFRILSRNADSPIIAYELEGVITKATGELREWLLQVQLVAFGVMYHYYTPERAVAKVAALLERNVETEKEFAKKYEDFYHGKKLELQVEVVPRL